MATSKQLSETTRRTVLSAMLTITAATGSIAADQYWNPTTTAKAAGAGAWDTSAAAWANTSAGTNAPLQWVDGNNAWFTLNSGVNTAVVNGVTANLVTLTQGTHVFDPGTGPLTLTGGLTNSGSIATFNTDVTLAADQNWNVSASTTVNGTLTGPYTLTKTGSSYLNISNANNNIGGLFLDSYYVRAYGGGNTVGGPNAALTMGSPNQTTIAKLEFYPLGDQGETSWSVGSLTANGFGEVRFVSDGTKTNLISFGALGRTNRGVLSLRQDGGAFDVRQRVTFSNGDQIAVNGILPPWVATQQSADFLAYDGCVKSVAYKTTVPATWTATDVVNNNATRALTSDAAVYAMRVSSGLTVPEGITLTNVSGGLIINNQTLSGRGTLDCGTNELIVYAASSAAIYPRIIADGLTVWGKGTLTVSNITWSGDTYLQQGNLKAIVTEDTTYTNNIRGALGNDGTPGEFIKDGPASLTLRNSNSRLSKLTYSAGQALQLENSSITTLSGGLYVPADNSRLVITNSQLVLPGSLSIIDGKNGASISIVGTGDQAHPTSVFCANGGGYTVGSNGGNGNSLTVDGGGITAGTVLTNITYNGSGLKVGSGTGSSNNIVRIINGGFLRDAITISNGGNALGIGSGANNNRIEIIGGNGYTSALYKGYANVIGSGSATGNVVLVDGAGYAGSAQFSANQKLSVGNSGAFGNSLILTNGGLCWTFDLNLGGTSNRVNIVGQGSILTGGGTFSLGTSSSTGGTFYVANGGEARGFPNYSVVIGGSGSLGIRMIIGPDGTVNMPNDTYIGSASQGVGYSAVDNQVLVTGANARWELPSSETLRIGYQKSGSTASGNELRVQNGGAVAFSTTWPYHDIAVGIVGDSVAGGYSTENRVVVTDGGQILYAVKVTAGSISGTSVSSNNSVRITTGGLLEADTLIIGANANNTIAATDGGVYQFRTTIPTITSLAPGDISINNGVISFNGLTTANVFGNQSTQLTNMLWSGANAFRLNNSSTTTGSNQSYLFDPGFGPTNYARLEMVDGTTVYQTRAQDTGSLTIGQSVGSGASMLCSNTTATVALPFVNNGTLSIVNSTLTFTTNAVINGTVAIDLDHLAEGGTPLVAQKDLTLGGSSVLRLSGTLPKTTELITLMTCAGTRTGTFTIEGLQPNYSVKYDLGGPGTVSIKKTPSGTVVLFF